MTRDTIPGTCPNCRRPRSAREFFRFLDECDNMHGPECEGFAAGFARGVDEGVRLAKAGWFFNRGDDDADWIDWTDVDEAAAKAKGER